MVKQKSLLKTPLVWIVGAVILLGSVGGLIWRFVSLARQSDTSGVIHNLAYCGPQLGDLCVLSFGRNSDNNLVVSLFVPDRSFPAFSMKIKRAVGESIYKCERNADMPTSAYCYGDMIPLQQKLEIDLISTNDESLLATGSMTLDSLLLASQSLGNGGSVFVTTQPIGTNISTTAEASKSQKGPTATPIPGSSYPNPSYP